MSNTSTSIGQRVLNGIDSVEDSATQGVRRSAAGARQLTKAGARWAAKHETSLTREAHLAKRRLEKQTRQLGKAASKSVDTAVGAARDSAAAGTRRLKQYPWSAIAATSVVALIAGALLGRRNR